MIRIQMATDFVCPYCLAAGIPLKQALEGREDVELELLPLELTPVSRERVDTYHDEERRAKWAEDLVPFCEKLGIEAHFPPRVIPRPYTHLAWQGYHYAVTKGKGAAYAEAMIHAYFMEEQDIGDPDVLTGIAGNLDLDREEFRSVLEKGTFSEIQDQAVERTRERDVKAVPTIWIGDIRLRSDLYTREDFEFYLDLASQGSSGSFGSGSGCGENGCG